MEFVQACFAENTQALICSLKFAGFSNDQAAQFLPGAASCFDDSAGCIETTRTMDDLLSANPAQVLRTINVRQLARKLKITPGLVRYGLDAIEPMLSEIMARKKDQIVEVIIALAWNDDGRLSASGKAFFHQPAATDHQAEDYRAQQHSGH